ncbi:hypothetical protein BS17DRAFT_763781 [Gyrodon lividus]|nr:hypothetical protein BS17DRAFT_763781 [Gyrodon lividus]
MADPNLETVPNYAGPEFGLIREGLRLGFHENNQQAIERLVAAWQANRDIHITTWNTQKEDEARAAEIAEQARRLCEEEEERLVREEVEQEHRGRKEENQDEHICPGHVGLGCPGSPPSQYALQKLNMFDFTELWYFSLAGCLDTAKYSNRS